MEPINIISRAPCRISVAGGGTDVDPFAFQHGGQVLNFAVTLYHTATLIPRSDPEVTLVALGGEERSFTWTGNALAYGADKKFDLLRAVINHFSTQIPSGFSLEITSPSVNPIGLGRSGSVAVAAIGTLNAWLKTGMSRMEIGLLGSRLEIEELGWLGGKQDPLVAAFGGVNLMSFGPGNDVRVNPVLFPEDSIRALQQRTLMVSIAGDRHSSDQQRTLIASLTDEDRLAAMISLRDAVPAAKTAFEAQNWSLLGEILHKAWEDKKRSNPSVTNGTIDKYYNLALRCGAYGGKISGSGGFGNMFFLFPPEKRPDAIREFTNIGAELVDFDFDTDGLTVQTTAV